VGNSLFGTKQGNYFAETGNLSIGKGNRCTLIPNFLLLKFSPSIFYGMFIPLNGACLFISQHCEFVEFSASPEEAF